MTENSEPPEDHLTELLDAVLVIQKFGGIRPAASLLGVAASTVQGWKERGVIPQNREQAILEIAAQHNIDLAGPRVAGKTVASSAATSTKKNDSPDDADPLKVAPAAKQPIRTPIELADGAPAKTNRSNNGVAWFALMLASGALIAVSTQPKWAPALFPQVSPAAVPTPVPKDLFDSEFARVESHIAALGDDLADLSTRTESAALLPELSPLVSRLDALESASGEDDGTNILADRVSELGDRLTALEAQLSGKSTDGDATVAIESLRSGVLSLSVEIAAWSARLAALEAVPTNQGGGNAAALVLAVGQLESAIHTGGPFAGALERVQTFGEGDLVVAGALAPLGVWAEAGIPTEAALRLRFRPLMSELEQPNVSDTANGAWWPRVRRQLSGLVTVRRVGLANSRSPVAQIELAVERGDLERAVAGLAQTTPSDSESVQAWLVDARARVAAEFALRSLGAHALDLLGKAGTATQ
jgi:hypothetical protein